MRETTKELFWLLLTGVSGSYALLVGWVVMLVASYSGDWTHLALSIGIYIVNLVLFGYALKQW